MESAIGVGPMTEHHNADGGGVYAYTFRPYVEGCLCTWISNDCIRLNVFDFQVKLAREKKNGLQYTATT